MSAVSLRTRTLFRARRATWLVLALVLGTVGGVCMSFAQSARHTDDAFDEFVEAKHAADVVLTGASGFGFVGSVDLDRVDRISSVAESGRAFVALPFRATTDDGRTIGVSDIFPVASADARLGSTVEAWKMTNGRAAALDRVDEATASSELARRLHLHVGSTLSFRFYDSRRFVAVAARFLRQWPVQLRAQASGAGSAAAPPDPADGPTVRVRVVGIEASPLEFPPLLTDLAPVLHLTPAFAHRYAAGIVGSSLDYVRLRHAGDLRAFQLAVERLAQGQPVSFVMTLQNQRAKVQRSLRAEALVLAIVAGLLALAGGVGVAQALRRQAASEASDDELLQALGMQRAQLRTVAFIRSLAIAIVAAATALVVAWLVSPLTLLSLGRLASLHTGMTLDAPTAIWGAASVLSFALLFGAVATRRSGSDLHAHGARRSRGGSSAVGGAAGLPASVALGFRFAVQRRGRSVPAIWTVLGAALGVATITLAVTFTAALQRDLRDPARYGWNWDLKLGAPGLPDLASELVPPLRDDARISDLSVGTVTQAAIGPTRLDVFAIDVVRGRAVPTLVSGHAPRAADEIVFGERSRRSVGTAIGRTVRARIGSRTAAYRVVGTAIFPEFGDSGQLGTGAWTTVAGLHRLAPDSAPRNTYLLRFRPSARAASVQEGIVRAVAPLPARESARPEDLVNLSRGEGLLFALGGLLAALVLAVIVHALLTAERRDRADHAVLRALGRTRGQTWATVIWQSLTLGAFAFLIGVPGGLVTARWVWSAYASRLGIETGITVPFAMLGCVFLGTVVVALLGAIVPAWLSARGDVVESLRPSD